MVHNSVRSGLPIIKLNLGSLIPLKLFKSTLNEENYDDEIFIYLHYSHQLYKIQITKAF